MTPTRSRPRSSSTSATRRWSAARSGCSCASPIATRCCRPSGCAASASTRPSRSSTPKRCAAAITPAPEGAAAGKRGDDRRLYQLYRKVTPQGVSQLEAPTYREWKALHGEWTGRLGTGGSNKRTGGGPHRARGLGRGSQLRARSRTRSSFHGPAREPTARRAGRLRISLLGDSEAPAWSSLRHYDSHMIDALRGRGFSVLLTQLLLVKELAVRVPNRCGRKDWSHRSDELPNRISCPVAGRRSSGRWDEEIELLARALPPDLARALHERIDPGELLEIVLDLGREPEARVPGREVLLADHPVSDIGPRVRRQQRRPVRRRQPRRHRAHAASHLGDPQPLGPHRRPDLPRRPRGDRHRRDHPRHRRQRPEHPAAGPAGRRQDDDAARVRARARRRAAQARGHRRHLERDRRRRRHPASRHRPRAAHAGAHAAAAARGDDRGGGEPHARGHRHRRDRHRARGRGRAHDRRARRAAHRHRARQDAREPADQPDAERPDRRHPDRDAVRRGGAAPRHAEVGARAQGAAHLRRAGRDPGPRPGRDPHAARRRRRHRAARAAADSEDPGPHARGPRHLQRRRRRSLVRASRRRQRSSPASRSASFLTA